MEAVKIGVIGGSGLYAMPELTDIERRSVDTPFGKPSADIVIGTLRGKRRCLSAPSRNRTPFHADDGALPRQYLRHEDARRAPDHRRQRLWFTARGLCSRSHRHPGSAL